MTAIAVAAAGPAVAQGQTFDPGWRSPVHQSPAAALAEDAADYAARHSVSIGDATRRLRAQEESVGTTDLIAHQYRARLAGISIEHSPAYRIVVLLTGADPVPEQRIVAGGMIVPITFVAGAPAGRAQIAAALVERQATIRAAFPTAQGMGLDPRTGELVLMVRGEPGAEDLASLDAELEALTGVPARIRALDRDDVDFAVDGGSRLVGTDPLDGRRYACTTGFVVTDGARTGILTAAHCPDTATHIGPDGIATPLEFAGQWGVGHQDVQLHLTDQPQGPYFYADRSRSALRTLTGQRNRTSTRAGDVVCHRGETTGYSCSEVELTDFAPPGDLCAGPCTPVWVTVTGPSCRNGDSGGPVFSGTTAFGIAKGGNYVRGRCSFYYYMSTDYLPVGWSLLTGDAATTGERVTLPL